MKKFIYAIFLFSFFIFLISLGVFFSGKNPIQTQTFYASVNIGDKSGFGLNSSALTFGEIQKHGSSTRTINFQNRYDFPVVAVIYAGGDIKSLLCFDEAVEIEKGEAKAISFSVAAPSDMNKSFYSGNVTFEVFKK